MKKLIIIFLMLTVLGAGAQVTEIKYSRDNTLLLAFDLSDIGGTDTSFIFKITKTPIDCWSIHTYWTGVTGSGSVSLEVSSGTTNWVPYAGSLSTTITGATGSDGWEDYMLAWNYIRIKITKGTLSAGLLTQMITIH